MRGSKLLWHMDSVKDMLAGKRIAPILMDIGATKKCQSRCSYCYGTYQKKSNDVIPGDVLVRLLSDAGPLGVKAITFTGDGEPTLNPAIYDAVETGARGGLDIGFATNGIAIDDKQNERFINHLQWLRYNLSAATPEVYGKVHGGSGDTFDRIVSNVKKSVELKRKKNVSCTIGLQMVLIPDCIDEVLPEAEMALELGVDYFVIKQFSDPGKVIPVRYDQSVIESDAWTTILKAAEDMSTDETQVIVKWPHLQRKGKKPYDRCVDCALLFQVSGNSKCYPCGYLFNKPEYCYGDLKKQTLGEILESERYWQIVRYMAEEFDVHKSCIGACRHDETNIFIWNYMHPPDHINHI